MDPSRARPDEPIAIVGGFNVHAARTLHGADHAQVERFVRYLARPPIAQDRLELPMVCTRGFVDGPHSANDG